VAALIILFSAASIAQVGAIILGGLAGLWPSRSEGPASCGRVEIPVSRTDLKILTWKTSPEGGWGS
jgi:chromate transporter